MTWKRPDRARMTVLAVVAVVAILSGGCGSDDDDPASTSSTDTTSASSSTDTSAPASSSAPDTTAASSSTTGTDTTLATNPTKPTDSTVTLPPGEEVELFAQEGDRLAVVGVAHDDTLKVRAGPGTDQTILTAVGSTADDLIATGQARKLSQSFWYEVTVDGVTGWVNVAFVAYLGATDDSTSEFLDGGPAPEAETMIQLGELVANRVASVDPPSDIVNSVAPSAGDVAEVTYDVVGIGDDSVLGFRLHIFATRGEGGDNFVLRTIERTILCDRGLSGELCV